MRQIAKSELNQVLQEHRLWLETDGIKGARADLQGTDLRGANLQGANLRGADLRWADLRGADLQSADLQSADLQSANLWGANLRGADLRGADLRDASLLSADLRNAKFDTNIRSCESFHSAAFTPDALPWLILHPQWVGLQKTIRIEEVAA